MHLLSCSSIPTAVCYTGALSPSLIQLPNIILNPQSKEVATILPRYDEEDMSIRFRTTASSVLSLSPLFTPKSFKRLPQIERERQLLTRWDSACQKLAKQQTNPLDQIFPRKATNAIRGSQQMASKKVLSLVLGTVATAGFVVSFPPIPRKLIRLIFTPARAEVAFRLLYAHLCGSLVGITRRCKERPVQKRLFPLVALGACTFTLCGTVGFANVAQKQAEMLISMNPSSSAVTISCDISRIAASVSTGVGFIGAGVITSQPNGDGTMQVRGLTTAASIWMSAAVGIAIGAGMYFPALFVALSTIVAIRFSDFISQREVDVRKSFSVPTIRSTQRESLLGQQRELHFGDDMPGSDSSYESIRETISPHHLMLNAAADSVILPPHDCSVQGLAP
eukprot:CAMPEP_0195523254 /NCGR_PEP_ID=MMETSP0794_2-20130614/22211_1 /TAXON_ID=515487 /ORGANISM="Stephanopyxis turris, Strain CCMP 815" /LENGTH=392 /DNA_ID=CAMNT_0040653201 /DNA_START=44 /DNA_END=1222 /DNA_ORIENTATION=+